MNSGRRFFCTLNYQFQKLYTFRNLSLYIARNGSTQKIVHNDKLYILSNIINGWQGWQFYNLPALRL